MSVSEWSDRFRVLPPGKGIKEPGPWRTDRTPYLREIMDALGPDSPYEEVVLKSAARVGKSEAGKCAVSYWAKNCGQTILLVFPDKPTAEDELTDHYEPMLRASPVLAELFTDRLWDVKTKRINLRSCSIRVGWSRSAMTLAGFQAPYQHWEEIDKWGQPRGEADPKELARARAMQFEGQTRIFVTSTPTLPSGPIEVSYRSCVDRRQLFLPCPHCGELTRLLWENVRWTGYDPQWEEWSREDRLAASSSLAVGDVDAWVLCQSCRGEIREADKLQALADCEWVSEGYPPGQRPRTHRVGYHLSALYSPWVTIRKVASEAFRLHVERNWQHFLNSWLGEVYELKERSITVELVQSCADTAHKPLIVPQWARALCAGIDTQIDHLVWVIRAFGEGGVSRGIDFGISPTWEDLERMVLLRSFMVRGIETRAMRVAKAAIDVGAGGQAGAEGNRTDEVYRWIAQHPGVVVGVRGKGGFYFPDEVEAHSPAKSGKGRLLGVGTVTLNVQHYKSRIAGEMHAGLWQEPSHASEDYAKQLAAEQLVLKTKGTREYYFWEPRYKGIANHFFDAAGYSVAASDLLRVDQIPTAAEGHHRDRARAKKQRKQARRPSWVQADNWGSAREGW